VPARINYITYKPVNISQGNEKKKEAQNEFYAPDQRKPVAEITIHSKV